jgi:phage baseplate assembly protein W
MNIKPTFIGYSTVRKNKPSFILTDDALIKQDLMIHFHTRKGERWHLPEYGCIIHDLLMDPLDSQTIELVRTECKRIVNSDPRVRLIGSIVITVLESTLRVDIPLEFVISGKADMMYLEYKTNFGNQ